MTNNIDMLKGFPLNVEQKERLLELIGNNKGGGGSSNIIEVYVDKDKVKINQVEYDFTTITEHSFIYKRIINKELYEYIKSVIDDSIIYCKLIISDFAAGGIGAYMTRDEISTMRIGYDLSNLINGETLVEICKEDIDIS